MLILLSSGIKFVFVLCEVCCCVRVLVSPSFLFSVVTLGTVDFFHLFSVKFVFVLLGVCVCVRSFFCSSLLCVVRLDSIDSLFI